MGVESNISAVVDVSQYDFGPRALFLNVHVFVRYSTVAKQS